MKSTGVGRVVVRRAASESKALRLTHSQRQFFRMLGNAQRPSGLQGNPGPPLLSGDDRKLALRLSEIGDDRRDPPRWPARERRDLTPDECRAAIVLLEMDAVQRWFPKWARSDPEGWKKIDALIAALRRSAEVDS